MKKASKLSSTILKSVSIRVLAVIIVTSIISYLHLYNTIEKGTKETLQKYVDERVKREESLFLLAQSNHEILKAETRKRFLEKPNKKLIERFDKLLRRLPDGTIRNKKELYDGTRSAGVFIPAEVVVTDELKFRIMTMVDIVETYGKAYRSRFQDTYYTTSDNIMVLYWPEVPNWTMEMKADFSMLNEEYGWVANRKYNPERKTVWTGAFYDSVGKTWMASIESPMDFGNWSATVGHDVMLDEFVSRVSKEHLDGTYNLIFRDDGRLITHPNLMADIEKNLGKLNVQTANDPFLEDIFISVTNEKSGENKTFIVEHPDKKNFLAFSRMGSTGWYFVTVSPHSLITSTALNGVSFLIILALASLAFEITILYFGIKRDVLSPLHKLEQSVTQIAKGQYQARLEVDRTDEFGELAKTFNVMAQEIYDNEKSLLLKVEERTRQVDEQRAVLIQKSKLASLGEMAGGIAHEINTPLAIIGMKVEQLHESIEEKSLDDEELKSSLDVIKVTNNRIAKIISGLRFVARDGSELPMDKANVSFIIDETYSFCAEKLRLSNVKIEIVKNFEKDLLIYCRSVEISQVLLNLLNNSMDAIAGLPQKWIQVVITDHGHEIEINVIDSGAGIPKDLREKIMQPFFTTKDIGKGTGLGLSISRGIVEAHQGKFFVDEDFENTKFTIILPKNAS